jgi:hypothetical protein
VRGYEIETACVQSNCKSLVPCVNATINFFRGRILDAEYMIENILSYLR